MSTRFLFKITSIALGVALLLAALIFDAGTASPVQQLATPTATLDPFERLAKPTVPANPSQADRGAQDYWLYCLPCHGDRGQGLTLEFRETYPPDEVNCWKSGCHGKSPYENGFTLPANIPGVIGENALQKFPNAAVLQSYIYAAMPYWKPGSLQQEEVWRITAFLLRENGMWNAHRELNESNAAGVVIGNTAATPTQPAEKNQPMTGAYLWAFILVPFLLILLIALQRWFRRSPS